MRVLVADDEASCRNLLRDLFLDAPDVELTMAEDGAEAWWLLTEPQRRFDVGVFDFRMPKIDGLALSERIRHTALLRHLPIILCSGVSDRETIARAASLQINHYIVKPFKPASLREKLHALVPRRAA